MSLMLVHSEIESWFDAVTNTFDQRQHSANVMALCFLHCWVFEMNVLRLRVRARWSVVLLEHVLALSGEVFGLFVFVLVVHVEKGELLSGVRKLERWQ